MGEKYRILKYFVSVKFYKLFVPPNNISAIKPHISKLMSKSLYLSLFKSVLKINELAYWFSGLMRGVK